MRSSLGVLPVVFVLFQALPGLVLAQEKTERQGSLLDRPVNAADSRTAPRPAPAPTTSRGVHLQIDGNLVGQIAIPGSTKPGHAQVNFVQGGKLIATVQSDEFGRFQIIGLTPGVYSIRAKGPGGVALLAVPILPFEANAAGEESILKLTLIPQADYDLLPKAVGKARPKIVLKPDKSASASPLTPSPLTPLLSAAASDHLKSQTGPLGNRGTDNVTPGGSTPASAP